MPRYTFKVRDKNGKMVEGQSDAANSRELRKKLDDQGYFLIDYSEKKSVSQRFSDVVGNARGVKSTELAVFSWQLYTMLDSGMTLVQSLKVIISQIEDKRFQAVLRDVCRRVEEGASLSEALKQYPRVFSRLYVQMVHAGEVGGVLDEMVRRLALYLEKEAEVRGRFQSALIYPAVLLMATLGVAIFLVTFVLPRFVSVFEEIGATIPLPTKMLMYGGLFLRSYWYLGVMIIGAAVFSISLFAKTPAGRYFFDLVKLRVPVFGLIVKKSVVSRFAQTVSILINSGITIVVALDVVKDVLDNVVVKRMLQGVLVRVQEGKTIAEPLEKSGLFPTMVVTMIRVGEETGELDKMLTKVAEFYEREIDAMLRNFSKVIEPVLIIFMTFVVGFIAMSIFLPIADLTESLKH